MKVSSNNGNVMSWNASGWDFTFNRAYTYDALNRVSTFNQSSGLASACSSAFSLSWNYDPWGNRTDQNVTGGTCNSFHATVDTKNRLSASPYQYDAAGNLTYDGSHSYTYDAEGRLTAVDGGSTATYIYDAEGNRVKRTVGSVVTVYALNPEGQVIHETDANLNFNVHYIYLGGHLMAEMKEKLSRL